MRVVKDRRSSLRVVIEGEVLVYTERDRLEAQCLDLGMEGVLVRSASPTNTRRLVTLEAFLGGQRLRLDAELVRHQEVAEGHELAFRFVDVIPQTARQIEQVILDRLGQGSQRDYAQAFERGALAGTSAPPSPRPSSTRPGEGMVSGETVVAGQPTPVISGLTEARIIDPPPAEHTVVAPVPSSSRQRTIVVDAATAGVYFDQSWDEDEADTARFRRITDDVGPGHTVRMDREGRPLPPEVTAIVSASALAGRSAPEPSEPQPSEPEPMESQPLRTADVGAPEPVMPAATEALEGARPQAPVGPPTMRLPFAAGLVRSAARSMETAKPSSPAGLPESSPEPSPEKPSSSGRSPAPSERPQTAKAPAAPPMLWGEITSADPPAPQAERRRSSPNEGELRPTQRALLQARALLRPRALEAPARRPRVIVTIPHRTYRRAHRIPWLR